MQSIWWSAEGPAQRPAFAGGEARVETVVIGAGMAGVLTAHLLRRSGREAVVLEAGRIAGGQTGNTTAKITSQHGLCYAALAQRAGQRRARAYGAANEAAIDEYEAIIREEGVACGFERLPAFLFSRRQQGRAALLREAEAAARLGLPARFVEPGELAELPFPVTGAVRFARQAQFHPIQFIRAIARGLTVYENTRVVAVRGHRVYTEGGVFVAKNIVFATHYPFLRAPGFYFLRQHQERSYVLALEQGEKPCALSAMYYSIDPEGFSLRAGAGRLLLGGGAHRTGQPGSPCEAEGFAYLRRQAQRWYPGATEVAHWAAQDCMPHDGIPFIGPYSLLRPGWYVATGFQKWGMTSAMVAALLVRDAICGRENPWAFAFSPQRLLVRAGARAACADAAQSAAGLAKGFFGPRERRCRHMGCQLTWNEAEQSWDCPCHGSRFNRAGRVLDGPAQP